MNANQDSSKPQVNRIQKASRVVRVFVFTAMVLQIAGVTLGLFVVPILLLHGLESRAVSEATSKICEMFLALPFVLLVTLNFFRLFTRLTEGHLFDSDNISYLEKAGKWWIVLGIVRVVFEFLNACLFHPKNFSVNGEGIIAGLIVFFIAWVMDEGRKIREEQELTV